MSQNNDFLLPTGTFMIGAVLPNTDADTVSALHLMNKAIVAGPLVEPYHPKAASLCLKNIFGNPGPHGVFTVAGLNDAQSRVDQRIPSGEVVLSVTSSRGPHARRQLQTCIFAQMRADQVGYILHFALDADGLCHRTHVLTVADTVLAELRDMVGKTPIRI